MNRFVSPAKTNPKYGTVVHPDDVPDGAWRERSYERLAFMRRAATHMELLGYTVVRQEETMSLRWASPATIADASSPSRAPDGRRPRRPGRIPGSAPTAPGERVTVSTGEHEGVRGTVESIAEDGTCRVRAGARSRPTILVIPSSMLVKDP